MTKQNNYAVMAQRIEAPDALDFFPTPPWATRALLEEVLEPSSMKKLTAWEPAAGAGHMAEVLREFFAIVHASDVHDYGAGYATGDFVGAAGGLDLGDRAACPFKPDWIITNPPFNLAAAFLARALREASQGVALLMRTAWIEGEERWKQIFSTGPPTTVAQFAERVAMVKGRWDPDASTATSYMWFVWEADPLAGYAMNGSRSDLVWIPPGAKKRNTAKDDRARFAGARP